MMFIQHIKELYKYRNLIWVLAWGEFKQRYKNSVLGFFWSLLEPLLFLTVLYVVFTNIMKVQVEYYPLFLLLGIIIWNFFGRSTTMGLNCIVGKSNILQKVYFPRDIFVISACITALLTSLFESIVFVLFMIVFRIPLSLNILYLPIFLLIGFILVLGTSLTLAALYVFYRDVQFVWLVILQIGFFITPVMYPLSLFEPNILRILVLNPMAQLIQMSRDVVIYAKPPPMPALGYTIVISLIIFIIGYAIFTKLESRFAEEL